LIYFLEESSAESGLL